MKIHLILSACLLFLAQILAAQTAPALELRNGQWFNGTGFAPAVWYVSGGLLTQKTPSKIDSVIDLENRWVVPPAGDAFVSCVAGNPSARDVLKLYMNEGIFYLQILGNTKQERSILSELTAQKAHWPDISFANGGITCTLGTPFMKYEPRAWDIKNPETARQRYDQIKLNRKMLGDAYWFFDKKDEVSKSWDQIIAQKPGAISIFLLDAEKSGGKEGKGLTPEVAKAVVKKADKANIPVVAHVETLDDVRLAIKLGVQGIAGLPGNQGYLEADRKTFELSKDDLKKLVKKKIWVTPLFSHAQGNAAKSPEIMPVQRAALKRLWESGVSVAVGSDDPSRTVRTELNYWAQMGELDNAAALRAMCETTPRAIFPERKIGKLAEGFEASFLVLNDNPLTNVMKMRLISFKVKNGILLK